jgi:single-stranded-DNA-specific exonuclease
MKKYTIKPKISDDLIEQLLHNRGVETAKEREIFLNPDFEKHLYDPFLLPDMEKAVKRILRAIEKNEKIGIWSDYDADGIPGGALLHDFFKMIGFNNFINYIPDRHSEGYGLNSENVEELAKSGVKLLVTIDCGIRDNKEIDHAHKHKIDVIVTDHHEPAKKLPKAYAVVNPKRYDSKYPETILCGAGVVWKLIQGILKTKKDLLKEGSEKWLLDLVALATLSDMVPLVGENRVLAHYGLKVLRKTRKLGLLKLFDSLKIKKENLNEDDIAFMITPRINAASRMGHPMDAFKLLTAEDEAEAESYVKHLDNINNERKGEVAAIVKEAKKRVREKFENEGKKKIIVLGSPNWRPALLGLAANSIVEEFNRPVFLWGRDNGDNLKGSCRSNGEVDLVDLMDRVKDHFAEFGGHKFSGGFSVADEKIFDLESILLEASDHIEIFEPEFSVDAELDIKNISEDLVSKILNLAPFGTGNEKPIFIFREILPEKISRFGKNQEHLSVNFLEEHHSLRAISFFTPLDKFGDRLKEGIKTNLVANIEKSFYNGSSEIRLRIVDFF